MVDQVDTTSQSPSRKRRHTPDENDNSPPTSNVSSQGSTAKPKQLPTITPRRFKRFFTPRSSLSSNAPIGSSRQVLRDITAGGVNARSHGRRRTALEKPEEDTEGGVEAAPHPSRKRKRATLMTPTTTSCSSSPSKTVEEAPPASDLVGECTDADSDSEVSIRDSSELDFEHGQETASSIVRWKQHCFSGQALRRECEGPGRIEGRSHIVYGTEWRHETTNFYSGPDDRYSCFNITPTGPEFALPFCALGCNTNPLVAIGDEEGGVRLLDSEKEARPREYLSFRPHTNAILDLAFSPDDLLLATASGDQTSQVIDMPTQEATYKMAGHTSSVKQVCFQPGSSSVIATSSRDGSVLIWDLRCKGYDGPVQELKTMLAPTESSDFEGHGRPNLSFARPVDAIHEGHAYQPRHNSQGVISPPLRTSLNRERPPSDEQHRRRGDVSVTALSFLDSGRDHLLLTGSDADSVVKLWDLRITHNRRRGRALPLSSTKAPESHHRQFGLNSMSLSGDGGRLYTLCRDNTIYAYSTAHLIIGHAPELSLSKTRVRRTGGVDKEGLGPIYGFRHPDFHAATFYIKSALRPATGENSELLAVGSSDGCAVLFPTDERYFEPNHSNESHGVHIPSVPPIRRTLWERSAARWEELHDTIQIYQKGTALTRGHTREVTGMSWTSRGELVTVGDDFIARIWREGPDAKNLRIGGESGGRRWDCGWAKAEDAWDDDD